ncbi:uncharacterized protein LOC144138431 [Haemaphysalis longicornis]|uniref:Ran gtpase-activating protein n=1 Tax=Haemaphysalis longicornis TaxID=44386 RepID=A0A9J6FST7_HAELO|nr:hypothetical protein HPB48_015034 [Haemaphysalis longicornis]
MENPPPPADVDSDTENRKAAPQHDRQLQQAAPDDTEVRTVVAHSLPCTASEDANAPVCQLFHQLPSWNRVLWHISLQLQEVDAPGELSLVRVSHDGVGWQQEQRSSNARVLFHALLTSHRCVTRVDLTDALFEGGTLNEIRELAVKALRENKSLRILNVSTLPDCNIIRADILTVLSRMVHLQELRVDESEDVRLVVDALQSLISASKSLNKLDISELVVDDTDSKRLSASLKGNRSVTRLSVHTSILIARSGSGVANFSGYLRRAPWIASLTVTGSKKDTSHEGLRGIIEPLLMARTISELTLIGFQLDARSTGLLAQLVARSVCLERLDIASCYWIPPRSSHDEDEIDESSLLEGEQERQAVSSYFVSFAIALSLNKSLTFLSLNLGDFHPYAIRVLITALSQVKSLEEVVVNGISLEDVRACGLEVRDGGLSGLVSFQDQYTICPVVLAALEQCPSLTSVIIDTRDIRRDLFHAAICRMPAWRHVTTLWLLLTQDALDNATVNAITMYLSETTALKELWMFGSNEADLRVCNSATNKSRSPLLEALFLSKSVHLLHVGRFVFGEENLRFLAGSVRNSDTLCEFYLLPLQEIDNQSFIRFLVPGIAANYTLLHLHASSSVEEETTEDQFIVQDVLARNRGLVTCAAQFVVYNVRTDHCKAAFDRVHRSPALVQRVRNLASVNETGAVAMIQKSVLGGKEI